MREYVAILYRGSSYELGRGVRFYGIWPAGRPQPQPIEWWPESPEGWAGAWARFTGLEPGAITPVGPGAGQTPPPPAPPPWDASGPGATVPAPPVPGQTGPGQAAPGQTVAGQPAPGQTIPGQTPGMRRTWPPRAMARPVTARARATGRGSPRRAATASRRPRARAASCCRPAAAPGR